MYLSGTRKRRRQTQRKHFHSSMNVLTRRPSPPTALFDLKFGEQVVPVVLSTFQVGDRDSVHYFHDFSSKLTKYQLARNRPKWKTDPSFLLLFYFSQQFRQLRVRTRNSGVQKRNKQDLTFILHQKSLESVH